MQAIDGFQQLLLCAHERDEDQTVSPWRIVRLALDIADWADEAGWTHFPRLGTTSSPDGRFIVSGGDGELTVVRDGRTLTYPTETVAETIGLLAVSGAIPTHFSTSARESLSALAEVFERCAEHLVTRHPGARTDAVNTWREAAESARHFPDRIGQLAQRRDHAAVA